jgi:hypothetical protein
VHEQRALPRRLRFVAGQGRVVGQHLDEVDAVEAVDALHLDPARLPVHVGRQGRIDARRRHGVVPGPLNRSTRGVSPDGARSGA